MKADIKILASLFIAAFFIGCNKGEIPDEGLNTQLDPTQKYIHFDTSISTRAIVEGDILQDHFAVLGYQYSGTWTAEKIFATPNVFDYTPQVVNYVDDNPEDNIPGIFQYNGGVAKPWTGNNYSFFAYYPSDHDGIRAFGGDEAKSGDPYIDYTLPNDDDPRVFADIMTASYVDTHMSSSQTVGLQFRHRLSAIDVGARNYYEYDHDNDKVTPGIPVVIEIINLVVNLANVTNNSARIYLDHNIRSEYPAPSVKATKTYNIIDSSSDWTVKSFDVVPNTSIDRNIRYITDEEGVKVSSLLLIPQTDLLTGGLTLTYKMKYKDGNDWIYIHEGDNENDFEFSPPLKVDFTKELIEGRRFIIEITFTSDAVSVNVITADEWDAIPDVIHEFE